MVESSVRRQKPRATIEAPKRVALEQAPPLLWGDVPFGPRSPRLNVPLRKDARKAVLPVALPLPGAEEFWAPGPKAPPVGKYPVAVLPVIPAPARSLLLKLKPALPAVVFLLLSSPPSPVLPIPPPSRWASAPFLVPLALIATLVFDVSSIPPPLILPMVGAQSADPRTIRSTPLPGPASAASEVFVGHVWRLQRVSIKVPNKCRNQMPKFSVIRETHDAPESVTRGLRLAGGVNRFGEANYRAVWGWNRLAWIGGKFEERDPATGSFLREVVELRQEPKYPAVNRWHIERWLPPEAYGSPRAWYTQTIERENGVSIPALGPYPSRGEYEHCFTLEGPRG